MKTAVAYGIDFGTSNSSISIAYDSGEVEVLELGDATMPHSLQSITYIHRDGNRLAGEEAIGEYLITGSNRTICNNCSLVVDDGPYGRSSECRQYAPGGFCNDSRLMYGLKSELANEIFERTHSWARDFDMGDLVGVIIRDLKTRADRHVGKEVDRVVVGMPVAFVGTEGANFDRRQLLAEQRLTDSARNAGFETVDLFYEPAAAMLDQEMTTGTSVVVDFGGGTFDIAVVEVEASGDGAEVIALQGAAVGGTQFDEILFDKLVSDEINLGGRFPAWFRNGMRSLMGVRSLLSHPHVREAVSSARVSGVDTRPIESILFGGQAYNFYKELESTKFALSESEHTTFRFRRPGIRLDATVSRSDFNAWITPHMNAVERAIDRALVEAEVDADEVVKVMRTGGSSEIPIFLDLIENKFRNAEMKAMPVFTAVASGLGQEAFVRWADD